MAWLDTLIDVFRGLSVVGYVLLAAALTVIAVLMTPAPEERRARALGLRLEKLTSGISPFGYPYCYFWHKIRVEGVAAYSLSLAFRFDGEIERFPAPELEERGWTVAELRPGFVLLRFDRFAPWDAPTPGRASPRTRAELAETIDRIDPLLKERALEPAAFRRWTKEEILRAGNVAAAEALSTSSPTKV